MQSPFCLQELTRGGGEWDKMALLIKAVSAEPDSLSSVPGSHRVKAGSWFPQLVLRSPHSLCKTHTSSQLCAHLHTQVLDMCFSTEGYFGVSTIWLADNPCLCCPCQDTQSPGSQFTQAPLFSVNKQHLESVVCLIGLQPWSKPLVHFSHVCSVFIHCCGVPGYGHLPQWGTVS